MGSKWQFFLKTGPVIISVKASGVDLDGCTLDSIAGDAVAVVAGKGYSLFPDMLDDSVYPCGYALVIPQSLYISADTARTLSLHLAVAHGNMPLEVSFHLRQGVTASATKLKEIVAHKWGPLFQTRLQEVRVAFAHGCFCSLLTISSLNVMVLGHRLGSVCVSGGPEVAEILLGSS